MTVCISVSPALKPYREKCQICSKTIPQMFAFYFNKPSVQFIFHLPNILQIYLRLSSVQSTLLLTLDLVRYEDITFHPNEDVFQSPKCSKTTARLVMYRTEHQLFSKRASAGHCSSLLSSCTNYVSSDRRRVITGSFEQCTISVI